MMRFLLIIFWGVLCYTGNATTTLPASTDMNANFVFQSSRDIRPAKTGFLKKVVRKTFQKRILKALTAQGAQKSDGGKAFTIIGLILRLLGLLLAGIALKSIITEAIVLLTIAVLLGLGGLVLCQIGLIQANATDQGKLWVKVLAYAGMAINLILSLASGGLLFLAYISNQG